MPSDGYIEKPDFTDHLTHRLVVAKYLGRDGEVQNISIECEDCNEVIFDVEIEVGDDEG